MDTLCAFLFQRFCVGDSSLDQWPLTLVTYTWGAFKSDAFKSDSWAPPPMILTSWVCVKAWASVIVKSSANGFNVQLASEPLSCGLTCLWTSYLLFLYLKALLPSSPSQLFLVIQEVFSETLPGLCDPLLRSWVCLHQLTLTHHTASQSFVHLSFLQGCGKEYGLTYFLSPNFQHSAWHKVGV